MKLTIWVFKYWLITSIFYFRLDYGPKTGLSNSKFMYQYDDNFRLTSLQGRIGGQTLPEYTVQYNSKTGAKSQMGQFMVI